MLHQAVVDVYLNDIEPEAATNTPPVIDSVNGQGKGTNGQGADLNTIVVNENAGSGVVAAVTAHDNEGNTIAYGLVDTHNALFSIGADGKISIDATKLPAITQDNDYVLTVTVTDGNSLPVTQNVTIRVKNNVNEKPIVDAVNPDTNGSAGQSNDANKIVVLETANSGVVAAVAAHDPNQGDTLAGYALADTFGGLFSIDATGKISFDKSKLPAITQDKDYALTVTATDNHGAVSDVKNVTIRFKDVPVAAGPTITGQKAQVNGESTGLIKPFENNLAVSHANNTDQLTIEVSFAQANGTFGRVNGVDPVDANNIRTYTFTGTRDTLNGILSGMQFDATDAFSGNATNTVFTVQVKPAADTQWSNSGAVTAVADINNNATFTAMETDQRAALNAVMKPFDGIQLADQESDMVTLTVTFAANHGDWSGLTSTAQVTVDNQSANGMITFTGSAANVTNFLTGVTFKPTVQGDTVFTASLVDAFSGVNQHGAVTRQYKVTGDSGPTLTAAAATTTIKDTATTKPFTAVTIADDSPQVTVLVKLDTNTEGTLSGDNRFAWSAADNAYKFVGAAVDAQAAIRNLTFTPTPRPNGAVDATEDTTFTIEVNDGLNPTVTNSNIVVRSQVENRAPTLVAAAYNPTIAHDQNVNLVNPFKDVAIGESNAGEKVTVTIKLDDSSKGVLTNLNGFIWNDDQKTYTFFGSAADAQVKIRALQYDPRDRPTAFNNEVTSFTIEVKDEHGGVVTNDSSIKVTSLGNNHSPTGISLDKAVVSEYAKVGDVVGTLGATDIDAGQTFKFSLVQTGSVPGPFKIVNNQLVLASEVNFEEMASHQIKVKVEDNFGGSYEQVFTIGVKDETTLNKRGTKKADKINGGPQDDILKGGSGNAKDTIKGLAGDDKLYGEGGNDSLLGGDGIDSLFGGKGNDILKGEAGRDTLFGDAGNDNLFGGADNDKLYGGVGNDVIKGDAGDDMLFGEAGNDKLYGGAGNDAFVFTKKPSKSANLDQVMDFKSGQDKIFLDDAVFKKLAKPGTLITIDAPVKIDASIFSTGRAKDSKDYLVYKGGVLYYDTNGSGRGGEVEIAKIKGLKAADIFII
ncbi:hypothetical protein [Microvirga sesbaniae]|uniref:hypothetical protein n=1 Tax=Microvirga sesbaniae TaxID=681392 RepID=UPI0021C82FC0|nr:hypothetical protein [Microvirga sp. HBU67692]